MSLFKIFNKKIASNKSISNKNQNIDERGNWTGKFDFFLSCLGYAVGLGNVWRFPYLCYKNGGAVFFIPYTLMLVFLGIPIFFMELSIGQFTSRGPLTCWEMAPFFKGIGVSMLLVSGSVAIYYNVIIAWAMYYLVASFNNPLPWTVCGNEWNTVGCYEREIITPQECTKLTFNHYKNNGTCMNADTLYSYTNVTQASITGLVPISAVEEYLLCNVFGKCESAGFHDIGGIRWQLALCLFAAWVLIFMCLCKGIKSSGKVVYVTALLPYVVLVILFIRGMTLEGHGEGIRFYIWNVDWSRLGHISVWKDAAAQIFFSLSASWGGLIALSSYNKFHNNILRDALLIPILNCLTSFFAGFVIFSFIGYLAHMTNTSVETVVAQGPGLAFVAYPYAISTMPLPQLWAILFFVMLITLGMDSQFTLIETIATGVMDLKPILRRHTSKFYAVICIVLYILGLVMCTNGGIYIFTLMDTYLGSWNLLLIAVFECICIGYVYGTRKFLKDIHCILNSENMGFTLALFKYTKYFWVVCWCFITPIGVSFVMVTSWINFERVSYGDYQFPIIADVIGWMLTLTIVFSGVFTSFASVLYLKGTLKERFTSSFNTTINYKPALQENQILVKHLPFSQQNEQMQRF